MNKITEEQTFAYYRNCLKELHERGEDNIPKLIKQLVYLTIHDANILH